VSSRSTASPAVDAAAARLWLVARPDTRQQSDGGVEAGEADAVHEGVLPLDNDYAGGACSDVGAAELEGLVAAVTDQKGEVTVWQEHQPLQQEDVAARPTEVEFRDLAAEGVDDAEGAC
jgi:hypothetical protein